MLYNMAKIYIIYEKISLSTTFLYFCAISQIIKNIMLLSYKLPLKAVIFYGQFSKSPYDNSKKMKIVTTNATFAQPLSENTV